MIIKLIAIIVAFAIICKASEDSNRPIVNTNYGKIQGFVDKSSKDREFYTFHNVPFAKDPSGSLRFKDPEKPEAWKGVRNGIQEHSGCSHVSLLFYMKNQTKHYEGKEDCLHLSVYTPKIDDDLLPVMLYIHGGAFVGGSGTAYTGHDLVNENVILVSTNYRLGALGFLSTEDDIMPGNLGLKDQIMALKWIQENIVHFGGDPSRVTIFGNSAGGASVHFLIMAPSAKGLFSGAILQAGTGLCPWSHSTGRRGIAHQVGTALGCFTPSAIGKEQSQRLLECMQKVDVKSLVMTLHNFMDWVFFPVNFNPYVDWNFIPDEPEILLKDGRYNEVNIIIGVNKDEGAIVTNSLFGKTDFLEKIQKKFDYYGPVSLGLSYESDSVELSKKVYDHYLNTQNINLNVLEEITEVMGDRHFKVCSDIAAQLHSQHGSNVYTYEFEYRGHLTSSMPFGHKFGSDWVSHTDELFYLFPDGIFGFTGKRNENDSQMTDIMTRLWANFARTGNPNSDDMRFKWDPFSNQSPRHLALNLKPEMKVNTRETVRKFWSSLPLEENKLLYGLQTESKVKSEL